jgi:hypothetical protein
MQLFVQGYDAERNKTSDDTILLTPHEISANLTNYSFQFLFFFLAQKLQSCGQMCDGDAAKCFSWPFPSFLENFSVKLIQKICFTFYGNGLIS